MQILTTNQTPLETLQCVLVFATESAHTESLVFEGPHLETMASAYSLFLGIVVLFSLTSRSNWESGASPHSPPPPDDSELSDGDVMVWRLEL